MAVFIYQTDALALMAELEGPEWLRKQADAVSPYNFGLWLEAWGLKQQAGPEFADEPLSSFVEHRFSGAVEPVIYGAGGFHRYVVRADGEIQFSAYHARPPKREAVQKCGFRLT